MGGLASALCVLLMFLTGMVPFATYAMPAAAGTVLLAVVMAITLVILYMLSQGQRRPLREVLPGVGGSLAAWMVLSMAFSYYVEHLGRYSVLYGSIATVIVVLLWLYMSGQILILGAEFSAALLEKRQTAAPSGGEEDA